MNTQDNANKGSATEEKSTTTQPFFDSAEQINAFLCAEEAKKERGEKEDGMFLAELAAKRAAYLKLGRKLTQNICVHGKLLYTTDGRLLELGRYSKRGAFVYRAFAYKSLRDLASLLKFTKRIKAKNLHDVTHKWFPEAA